jgi:hypothetical protein
MLPLSEYYWKGAGTEEERRRRSAMNAAINVSVPFG